MQRLGRLRPEVPDVHRAAHIGTRIAFLRMDDVRKLQRVADEKHWRIVADNVPVAFFDIELDREAAHVAFGIGRTSFTCQGRETLEHFRLFADCIEYLRLAVLRDVMRNFQRAECTRSLRLHAPFGITSRSKCASFSISQKSCNVMGPRGPTVCEFWLSPTGAPDAVVKVLFAISVPSGVVGVVRCTLCSTERAGHAERNSVIATSPL